jgi:hypothetical protein
MRINHTGHTHPNTPGARQRCRHAQVLAAYQAPETETTHEERFEAAMAQALKDAPGVGGARSRAKTNEYRAETLKVKGLPKCKKCNSHRYDDAVTGPDVDGMCGPTYCHYALEN